MMFWARISNEPHAREEAFRRRWGQRIELRLAPRARGAASIIEVLARLASHALRPSIVHDILETLRRGVVRVPGRRSLRVEVALATHAAALPATATSALPDAATPAAPVKPSLDIGLVVAQRPTTTTAALMSTSTRLVATVARRRRLPTTTTTMTVRRHRSHSSCTNSEERQCPARREGAVVPRQPLDKTKRRANMEELGR